MTDMARGNLERARKTRPRANYSGKDMAKELGDDLTEGCFLGANLKDTDWSGVKSMDGIDFRCANLTGANLPKKVMNGWDCSGALMAHAVLDEAVVNGVMHGVILSGASMKNLTWNRGGFAGARYVVLPERVDFSTWKNGRGFHAAIAKVIEQECDGDVGALRACDYIHGQCQRYYYEQDFPCWIGFVKMCHAELKQKSIDIILSAFATYPQMRLTSMWQWAEREINRKEV